MGYSVDKIFPDQIKDLKSMAYAFAVSTGRTLNFDHWHQSIKGLLEHGIADGCALVCDGNIVGALIWSYFPCLVSGELQATELCWYVDPDHRGKDAILMLDFMEVNARSKECKQINMVHLDVEGSDRIKRLYKIRGFSLKETAYGKRLD